jgi:hypothetical protein
MTCSRYPSCTISTCIKRSWNSQSSRDINTKVEITAPSTHLSPTPPVTPPRPPPLLPPLAVKGRLPQLGIHLVVRLAKPPPKVVPRAHPRRVARYPRAKVLGARPARVQPRQRVHQRPRAPLVPQARLGRVLRRHAVQQRPRRPPQLLHVGGAVGRGDGGGLVPGGLLPGEGGPVGEGGAVAAAGSGG